MPAEAFGQLFVDVPDLFPVVGRGIAVIVTSPHMIPHEIRTHPKDFRVIQSHPDGAGAGRGGKHGVDTVVVQVIDDLFKPVKFVVPFLGFKCGPGKDADRSCINMGSLHQLDIFFQDVRAVQPLVRIIVAAMQHLFIQNVPFHDD